MPIDPAGTIPGLKEKSKEIPTVHVRCRNSGCDSILAIEIEIPGQKGGSHLYQCCKCKRTWGVAMGGSVEL
jgi:hypothetical protein